MFGDLLEATTEATKDDPIFKAKIASKKVKDRNGDQIVVGSIVRIWNNPEWDDMDDLERANFDWPASSEFYNVDLRVTALVDSNFIEVEPVDDPRNEVEIDGRVVVLVQSVGEATKDDLIFKAKEAHVKKANDPKVKKALEEFEWKYLCSAGLRNISGGFAHAKIIYEPVCAEEFGYFIVELTSGVQSDVENDVHIDRYKMDKATLEITE